MNEARSRAQAFGSTQLVGPTSSTSSSDLKNKGRTHSRVSNDESANNADRVGGRSDIVVSSQAQTLNEDSMKADPDALENRPRGFFSDQVSARDLLKAEIASND